MHFWELYLSCVYCLCVFVVLCVYLLYSYVYLYFLCVSVVPYVYLLYYVCICCTSYVYLLYYLCIAVLTLDAGLLSSSQYPEGPATGHLDTGFLGFPLSTNEF